MAGIEGFYWPFGVHKDINGGKLKNILAGSSQLAKIVTGNWLFGSWLKPLRESYGFYCLFVKWLEKVNQAWFWYAPEITNYCWYELVLEACFLVACSCLFCLFAVSPLDPWAAPSPYPFLGQPLRAFAKGKISICFGFSSLLFHASCCRKYLGTRATINATGKPTYSKSSATPVDAILWINKDARKPPNLADVCVCVCGSGWNGFLVILRAVATATAAARRRRLIVRSAY